MVNAEGAFHGTHSRVAIPFNYDQSSPQQEVPCRQNHWRIFFHWSDDKGEANSYTSSATISYVQTERVSANMADNNDDDDLHRHMEAQEQTSRA